MSDEDLDQRAYRALAGISRARLLAVLRASPGPMSIRDLAAGVDLHPNTAREHLDQLVAAGFATRQAAAPTGRGRPGYRYAARRGVEGDSVAYRALAGALAAELAAGPDPERAATGAGERWGRHLSAPMGPATSAPEAMDRLLRLLDEAGFAPEPGQSADGPIRLRRCPFGALARERRDVVCGVHLGLMRGALRQMGAPLDAVALEPFVQPDLCLAHLAPDATGAT